MTIWHFITLSTCSCRRNRITWSCHVIKSPASESIDWHTWWPHNMFAFSAMHSSTDWSWCHRYPRKATSCCHFIYLPSNVLLISLTFSYLMCFPSFQLRYFPFLQKYIANPFIQNQINHKVHLFDSINHVFYCFRWAEWNFWTCILVRGMTNECIKTHSLKQLLWYFGVSNCCFA